MTWWQWLPLVVGCGLLICGVAAWVLDATDPISPWEADDEMDAAERRNRMALAKASGCQYGGCGQAWTGSCTPHCDICSSCGCCHTSSPPSRGVRGGALNPLDNDPELLQAAQQAIKDLCIALITVQPHLDKPYSDDPRWTPWTRFVESRFHQAAKIDGLLRKRLAGCMTTHNDGGGVMTGPSDTGSSDSP